MSCLGVDLAKLSNNYILVAGAKMLGLALVSMSCTIAVCYLAALIAAGVGRDLRENVYRKVLSFANQDIEQFSTASLITRTTNDVTNVTMAIVMLLRIVFYAPIIGAGASSKCFTQARTWRGSSPSPWAQPPSSGTTFAVAMPKFKGMPEACR